MISGDGMTHVQKRFPVCSADWKVEREEKLGLSRTELFFP